MLLAAMLAMMLVAAAPALAQATVTSDDDVDNSVNQTIDSDVIQAAAGFQYNSGNANAAADDGTAEASISQELTFDQSATQNNFAAGDSIYVLRGYYYWYPHWWLYHY